MREKGSLTGERKVQREGGNITLYHITKIKIMAYSYIPDLQE